jgi:hypothetical protein
MRMELLVAGQLARNNGVRSYMEEAIQGLPMGKSDFRHAKQQKFQTIMRMMMTISRKKMMLMSKRRTIGLLLQMKMSLPLMQFSIIVLGMMPVR